MCRQKRKTVDRIRQNEDVSNLISLASTNPAVLRNNNSTQGELSLPLSTFGHTSEATNNAPPPRQQTHLQAGQGDFYISRVPTVVPPRSTVHSIAALTPSLESSAAPRDLGIDRENTSGMKNRFPSSHVKLAPSDVDPRLLLQVVDKCCMYPLDSPDDLAHMIFKVDQVTEKPVNSEIRDQVNKFLQ